MPRIEARFEVVRGGVPLLELAGNADQPATVSFACLLYTSPRGWSR